MTLRVTSLMLRKTWLSPSYCRWSNPKKIRMGQISLYSAKPLQNAGRVRNSWSVLAHGPLYQHGLVITCPVKCDMTFFIHSQTSTVPPLRFGMISNFLPHIIMDVITYPCNRLYIPWCLKSLATWLFCNTPFALTTRKTSNLCGCDNNLYIGGSINLNGMPLKTVDLNRLATAQPL